MLKGFQRIVHINAEEIVTIAYVREHENVLMCIQWSSDTNTDGHSFYCAVNDCTQPTRQPCSSAGLTVPLSRHNEKKRFACTFVFRKKDTLSPTNSIFREQDKKLREEQSTISSEERTSWHTNTSFEKWPLHPQAILVRC